MLAHFVLGTIIEIEARLNLQANDNFQSYLPVWGVIGKATQ